jgi:cytochrome c oxidase cbb3-type subunit 4
MDLTLLRIIVTVVSFLVFVGICLYCYSGSNREKLEKAGWIALDDEPNAGQQEGHAS